MKTEELVGGSLVGGGCDLEEVEPVTYHEGKKLVRKEGGISVFLEEGRIFGIKWKGFCWMQRGSGIFGRRDKGMAFSGLFGSKMQGFCQGLWVRMFWKLLERKKRLNNGNGLGNDYLVRTQKPGQIGHDYTACA